MGKVRKRRSVVGELALAIPSTQEFPVLLDMRRQSVLGLDVDWTDGKTLYIKSVQPGAVQDWNRTQRNSAQAVQAGSRIIEVNGFRGDPVAMASLCRELCTSQGMLSLIVRAPAVIAGPMPDPRAGAGQKHKKKKDKRVSSSGGSSSN